MRSCCKRTAASCSAATAIRARTASTSALVRYNTDGSLDTTFDNGGKVTTAIANFGGRDSIYALAWQTVSDQKRIVAVGGEGDFVIARYTTEGALDAGFGNGGTVRGGCSAASPARRAARRDGRRQARGRR